MSAATAAFLAAWRRAERQAATLVKVELTDPGALTLYLALGTDVSTPGSPPQTWEAALSDVEPIHEPCDDWPMPGWSPCTGGFTVLANQPLAYAPTAAARTAFSDYRWIGAAVTFYRWELSLTDFADARAFKGFRVQNYEFAGPDKIAVHCIQRTDWNKLVRLPRVTKRRWPRASEQSLGLRIGSLRGAIRSVPLIDPWPSLYGNAQHVHEHLSGGRLGIPGVVTDVGLGGDAYRDAPENMTQVLFTHHHCHTFDDLTEGCVPSMVVQDKLCLFDPRALMDFNADGTYNVGAGFYIPDTQPADDQADAFYPLVPVSIDLEGTVISLGAINSCAIGVASITRAAGSYIADGVSVGMLLAGPYTSGSDIGTSFPQGTRVTVVAALTLTLSKAATTNSTNETARFVPGYNAESPRAILDPWNVTSYARLDYDAGYRVLKARLPTISPPGKWIRSFWEIGYRSVGSMANVEFLLNNPAGGHSGAAIPLTGFATPNYDGNSFTINWGGGNGMPDEPWAFADSILRVQFTAPSPGVKLDIFWIGGILQFAPERELIGHTVVRVARYLPGNPVRFYPDNYPYRNPGWEVYSQLEGEFYATAEGYEDDGSGTYSGVADALIERPCDVLRHVLAIDGAQSAGQIESGASAFGSFVDARAELKTWRQSDMVCALSQVDDETVADLIGRVCADHTLWVYLSPHDDKFHCIVLKAGKSVDYSPKLEWPLATMEPHPKLTMEPGSRVAIGVTVPYRYSHHARQTLHQCFVRAGASQAGYKYRNMRDEQQFEVFDSGDEQNDQLDFSDGGVRLTAALTPGVYSGWDLAQEAVAQLEVIDVTTAWNAGYGPKVVAGINDTIRFYDGTSAKTATISASEYATMEALAAAAAVAINAVTAAPANWSCSYSRSTRKITISRAAGTAELRWGTGAIATIRAMGLLGYKVVDKTGGLSYAADYEREEERFYIGEIVSTLIDFNWETGANGSLLPTGALNCAALFGFDGTRDSLNDGSGTDVFFFGSCPRRTREQICADAEEDYGSKRLIALAGTTIYDDDTARETRNRRVDLHCVARPDLWLLSDQVPDLERGKVLELGASMDTICAYAVADSDGSFAGKKFMALDLMHHMGPVAWEDEALAIEIS